MIWIRDIRYGVVKSLGNCFGRIWRIIIELDAIIQREWMMMTTTSRMGIAL